MARHNNEPCCPHLSNILPVIRVLMMATGQGKQKKKQSIHPTTLLKYRLNTRRTEGGTARLISQASW